MTYYTLRLLQTEKPAEQIRMMLGFVPRPGDFIRTSQLTGRLGFEVLAVYAAEPAQHADPGLIEVHVRAVSIPDIFTQPES